MAEGEGGPQLRLTIADVIEAVSFGRGDKIDDILRWPASRLQTIYSSLVKRQAREAIEAQKNQMIGALYANPNWDDSKADRAARIKELEGHFKLAIELIYDPNADRKHEQQIDWSNPFWSAAKRAHERNLQLLASVKGDEEQREAMEFDAEQLKARQRSREAIDQL